ncbi:Holliday junction resolvase RuvX [Algicola sagamiensis]|uniref:Holliday junction resolvase RuvX n=1 Tax=Algicola sagamiensis TaxID=163869 RepID=UPI00036BE71D|nr:Holliday junction resolvase RuvX [Algicola sagamiensis]
MTKNIGERTALAFDFGMKSIGIAVGQEVTGSARGITAIKAKDGIPNWDDIQKVIDEWQPDILIVGLPLNMDGTKQQVTFSAQKFANRLHNKFRLPVETKDERLTTVDARARLFEQGGYRNLKKDSVDAESAKLILESWFEAQWD